MKRPYKNQKKVLIIHKSYESGVIRLDYNRPRQTTITNAPASSHRHNTVLLASVGAQSRCTFSRLLYFRVLQALDHLV